MTRYVIEPDVALALAASKVVAVATMDDLLNRFHTVYRFERRRG